jgi:hypothetical protein
VLPSVRQPSGCIHTKEVTQSRPSKPVDVLVGSEERQLRVETDTGFFIYLANCGFLQTLIWIDATSRNLRAHFGMVSVVEHLKAVFALDVDDDSLPQPHRLIVVRTTGPSGAPVFRNDA